MVEKLTHPITVKFCERGIATLQALSAARGMEVSEYMRHLVNEDKKKAKELFDALKPIFDQAEPSDKENDV